MSINKKFYWNMLSLVFMLFMATFQYNVLVTQTICLSEAQIFTSYLTC